MTRLRIEPAWPREEYAPELRLALERLVVEATDFFLLSAADWLAVAGGGSVFAGADKPAFVSVEVEVSGVDAAAFTSAFVGGAVPRG